MKIKSKIPPIPLHLREKNGQTSVTRGVGREAVITHSQSYRVTANYSSTECQYGLQFVVDDDSVSIKKGVVRAEEMIEKLIGPQLEKQARTLNKITGA